MDTQITSAALMLTCSFNGWSPSRVPWPATTRTTSAGADVEEGVQTDDVVAEVVDDDRVSFHLEVALNIMLDGLGEGGRCNIRPRRERGWFLFSLPTLQKQSYGSTDCSVKILLFLTKRGFLNAKQGILPSHNMCTQIVEKQEPLATQKLCLSRTLITEKGIDTRLQGGEENKII